MAYENSNLLISKSKDIEAKQKEGEAFNAGVKTGMTISAHPYDQYKAGKDDKEYIEGIYKKLQINKEAGKDPSDIFKDGIQGEFDLSKELGKNKSMMIAGNPSFDINETPATRRTRKIRTLQERGVGGEKGNAGDILKKGLQLPDIQASATSRQIRDRLKLFTKGSGYNSEGGSLRDVPDVLRKQLLIDAKA